MKFEDTIYNFDPFDLPLHSVEFDTMAVVRGISRPVDVKVRYPNNEGDPDVTLLDGTPVEVEPALLARLARDCEERAVLW